MKRTLVDNLQTSNVEWANSHFPALSDQMRENLASLTSSFKLSARSGDITLFDGHWYVTHSGLLRIAANRRCAGIRTAVQGNFCNPAAGSWVFKAVVYKSRHSRGFIGYGDASPANV